MNNGTDGLSWAVLFNTISNPKGDFLADKIEGALHSAADRVTKRGGFR